MKKGKKRERIVKSERGKKVRGKKMRRMGRGGKRGRGR